MLSQQKYWELAQAFFFVCFASPSNLEKGSNFFAALASGSHVFPDEMSNRRLPSALGDFCDPDNWPRKEGAEEGAATYHAHFM